MPDRALPLLPVDGLGRAAAEPAAPPSRAALPALPPRDAAARPTSRRRVPPPVPARADSSEPPVPGHSPRPEAGIAEEAEPPDPQTIALTRALMNGKPVEVFSPSMGRWQVGIVVEILSDTKVRVNYAGSSYYSNADPTNPEQLRPFKQLEEERQGQEHTDGQHAEREDEDAVRQQREQQTPPKTRPTSRQLSNEFDASAPSEVASATESKPSNAAAAAAATASKPRVPGSGGTAARTGWCCSKPPDT